MRRVNNIHSIGISSLFIYHKPIITISSYFNQPFYDLRSTTSPGAGELLSRGFSISLLD